MWMRRHCDHESLVARFLMSTVETDRAFTFPRLTSGTRRWPSPKRSCPGSTCGFSTTRCGTRRESGSVVANTRAGVRANEPEGGKAPVDGGMDRVGPVPDSQSRRRRDSRHFRGGGAGRDRTHTPEASRRSLRPDRGHLHRRDHCPRVGAGELCGGDPPVLRDEGADDLPQHWFPGAAISRSPPASCAKAQTRSPESSPHRSVGRPAHRGLDYAPRHRLVRHGSWRRSSLQDCPFCQVQSRLSDSGGGGCSRHFRSAYVSSCISWTRRCAVPRWRRVGELSRHSGHRGGDRCPWPQATGH